MSDNRLIKKLNLSGLDGRNTKSGDVKEGDEIDISDMMMDPRYLRQSSALINDSLQKGFDVLQLSDGGIVTTGTKTVVHHYRWDEEKGKLIKTRSETSGAVPAKSTRKNAPSEDKNISSEEDAQDEDA